MKKHTVAIRVYCEDTDFGGIVHHSNYLRYFARARIEALRAQGFELSDLLSKHDTQFVVYSAEIQYLQAARLDQLLYVTTEVLEQRAASISYNQRVYLGSLEGPLLCKAIIRLACVNGQQRPKRLPAFLSKGIRE